MAIHIVRTPETEDWGVPPIESRIGAGAVEWLAERRHRPLLVAVSPLPSALTLAIEAVGGPGSGGRPEWVAHVRAALDRRDRVVLAPLAASAPRDLPACLVPAPDAPGAPPEQDIERIVATPAEVLLSQLGQEPGWDLAARAPTQWLAAYGRALTHACDGLRPLWDTARSLLDREVERVGAAVVRGRDRELVAALLGAGGAWSVRAPEPAQDAPRPGSLVAVPLFAGPHATIACYRGRTLTHVAYPLPGAQRLGERSAPPPQLDPVVGAQKARILRWLDAPGTVGEIAEMLQVVPGAASRHIALLERGGLVERERRGRSIVVRRSARGSALVALYDGA